ncbi:hypothetical protein K8R78_00835 [bacterium]|nr:hypothetical protein [bacterium]
MRKISLFLTIALLLSASAEITLEIGEDEAWWPTLFGDVSVQYRHYFGEDDVDNNYQVPSSNFMVRHVGFGFAGNLGDYIEYAAEFGVASCGSGGTGVSVKEALLFFKPIEWLGLGIQDGHVRRGFIAKAECTDMPLPEKPHFFTSFGSCHMFGLQIWGIPMFTDDIGIEFELGYYNGANGTVDIESNLLGSLWVHLPLGISVGGHYEIQTIDFDFDRDFDNVWRASAGLSWNWSDIHLQGEYFLGKGFYTNVSGIENQDLESNAYYARAAYRIDTGWEPLHYVEPHLQYESWDKATNANDGLDYNYSNLTFGVGVGLGGYDAELKISYDKDMTADRDYEAHGADVLYIRLQAGF